MCLIGYPPKLSGLEKLKKLNIISLSDCPYNRGKDASSNNIKDNNRSSLAKSWCSPNIDIEYS